MTGKQRGTFNQGLGVMPRAWNSVQISKPHSDQWASRAGPYLVYEGSDTSGNVIRTEQVLFVGPPLRREAEWLEGIIQQII